MKLFNRIEILEQGDVKLRFSDAVGQAIGVKEGMTLHGLAIGPPHSEPDESEPLSESGTGENHLIRPVLSMILSPFPLPAWPNLLRMSITVSPVPRALAWVVGGLNRLGIFCRHMESTDGLDLRKVTPKHAIANSSDSLAEVSTLIIPSTLLVVEIPKKEQRREALSRYLEINGNRDEQLAEDASSAMRYHLPDIDELEALHEKLRSLVDYADSSQWEFTNDQLREDLGQLLSKVTSGGLSAENAAPYANTDSEEVNAGSVAQENNTAPRNQCISVKIDWISPMTALNRLGRLENFSENPDTLEGKWRAWHARARSRKKFVVKRENGSYTIEASPWSNQIWNTKRIIPDLASFKERTKAAAVCHADSDEQVICWDLFPQDRSILVAFNLLIPAGGSENNWWEWILSTIGKANGNVLTAHASARRDGDWGVLEVVVLFPFDDSGQENSVRGILHCFRTLQGLEGRVVDDFHRYIRHFDQLFDAIPLENRVEDTPRRKTLRTATTLHVHAIWDPKCRTTQRDYWTIFRSNPFYFTRPLDQQAYQSAYGLDPAKTYSGIKFNSATRTRSLIADRIIVRLSEKENIAIIGAHRSGKTSVLNLIADRLNMLSRQTQGMQAAKSLTHPPEPSSLARHLGLHANIFPIVVRIHAATTPPYALLPEILDRLQKFAEQREDFGFIGNLTASAAREVSSELLSLLRNTIALAAGSSATNVAAGAVQAVRGRYRKVDTESQLRAMIKKDGWRSLGDLSWLLAGAEEDQAIAFFKRSLDQVRRVVAKIEQEMPCQEGAESQVFVVVLVDEVAKLSGWGDRGVLQTWRRAIEDRNYQSIRWVISASRPVSEFEALSPITNVFKEYNLGSLENDECEMLMDAFSAPTAQRPSDIQDVWHDGSLNSPESTASTEPERTTGECERTEGKIQPIMTYLARHAVRKLTGRLPFFLQVFLYHLYEQATRRHLPIVYRRLSCTVLEQEVIPEISDFLEAQWSNVPAEIQDQVYLAVVDLPMSAYELTKIPLDKALSEHKFSPSVGKVMLRSGLKGEDGLIIAPLVSLWLKGHQRAKETERLLAARSTSRLEVRPGRDQAHD